MVKMKLAFGDQSFVCNIKIVRFVLVHCLFVIIKGA